MSRSWVNVLLVLLAFGLAAVNDYGAAGTVTHNEVMQ